MKKSQIKNLKYVRGLIKVKQDENKITVIASDETLDRHGDVLAIDSWDLAKFKLSPRMLVDHDHQVSSIVGKWENPRIEDKKLLMDANFHKITELSRAVSEMVKQGYLDTVSVGFIMHGPKEDGGTDTFELIETSWVTVPANPNARVQASLKSLLEKKLDEAETVKVKDYMKAEDIEDENDELDAPLKDEEDDDEVVLPPEIPVAEVLSADKLIELGFDICKTVAEVNKWNEKGSLVVVCEAGFISKLIADSEKLLTLTQNGQASFQNRLLKESFKEAARMINHSLMELNKVV